MVPVNPGIDYIIGLYFEAVIKAILYAHYGPFFMIGKADSLSPDCWYRVAKTH